MSDTGSSSPLASPLFTSSVYTLADLDALDAIYEGESTGFIYARDGHPNAERLNQRLCQVESAGHGMVAGSGMAGLSALILSLVGQGDHVLASEMLYGRTTQMLRQELSRFGVSTTFVDPCDFEQVRVVLESMPRLLLVETMSNPLVRVVDVARLAKLAHAQNCLLIVDNTFATPIGCRPLEQGADFVVESLTKMISGHSDVTLGWIGISPQLKSAEDWAAQIRQVISIWGFSGSPMDSWLTERGMATLELRMNRASDNALSFARWLEQQSGITRVDYPGLSSHPDHEIASRTLHNFGCMMSFELSGGREGVNRLMRAVPEIAFSPSLGNVTTTWSYPAGTSHRYDSPAQRQRQGITDGLIRLSVGIEDVAKIQAWMEKGLKVMDES